MQSVADASFDAWIKYYRADENTPNATISYYAKGSLVALCFDLTLRSEGKGSLDDAMRLLWQKSGGGPIDEADIAAALEAVGGRSYERELAAWVHGTDELPLAALLQRFAVEIDAQPATLAQRLGVRVNESALTGVKVTHVLRDGAGERAGLAPGDELIAAAGWRLRRLDDAARVLPQDGATTLARRPRPARAEPAAGPGCARAGGGRRASAQAGREGGRRGAPPVRGMDRRLNDAASAPHGSRIRRRVAWCGLLIGVVLVHLVATRELADRMASFEAAPVDAQANRSRVRADDRAGSAAAGRRGGGAAAAAGAARAASAAARRGGGVGARSAACGRRRSVRAARRAGPCRVGSSERVGGSERAGARERRCGADRLGAGRERGGCVDRRGDRGRKRRRRALRRSNGRRRRASATSSPATTAAR